VCAVEFMYVSLVLVVVLNADFGMIVFDLVRACVDIVEAVGDGLGLSYRVCVV
jgi:hypothetical protein